MHSVFVIAALVLLVAGPAAARSDAVANAPATPPAAALESLLARLAALPGLSARFEEERRLALLVEPLRSRGVVYFSPPDLLLRRTDEPVAATLLVLGEELRMRDAGGERRVSLSAHPLLGAFADTFRGILGGDVTKLRAHYHVQLVRPEPEWELRLVPLGPPLASAIERIVVRGRGVAVRDLAIRDTRGGDTLTRFSEVDAARRFSDAERRELFAP